MSTSPRSFVQGLLTLLLAVVPVTIVAPLHAQIRTILRDAPLPTVQASVSQASTGPQVTWQALTVPVTVYRVLRTPSGGTASVVAEVPANATTWIDQGWRVAAGYQVAAVFGDGRTSTSAMVQFTPTLTLATRTAPTSTIQFGTRPGDLAGTGSTAAPTVTDFINPSMPAGMQNTARRGDTLLVRGTGLANVTAAAVRAAERNTDGTYRANPYATAVAVAPLSKTADAIRFVPNVSGLSLSQGAPFIVELTTGSGVIASTKAVQLFERPIERYITSVDRRFVRSGQRLTITGVNFNPADATYGQVNGGFIGNGTQGSTENPLLGMWNLSNTSVQLMAPPNCNSKGPLELAVPQTQGSPFTYILPRSGPIEIVCVSDTPSGTVLGTETGTALSVAPGSKIIIRGKGFRAVTGVRTGNTNLPLTWRLVPTSAGQEEMIEVTLPTSAAQTTFDFSLDNGLIEPVVNGSVRGTVMFLMPPRLDGVGPLHGEAGQWIRLTGSGLMPNGQRPTITVGGVPAQIMSSTDLEVYFAIPAGAPNGSLQFTSPAGTFPIPPVPAPYVGQHPGFFVVSGPSVVDSVVGPRADGQIVTVYGKNLARLNGLCFMKPGIPTPIPMTRGERISGGLITSNTQMPLQMRSDAAGTSVLLYAPTTPPGQYPPSSFSCTPNPSAVVF